MKISVLGEYAHRRSAYFCLLEVSDLFRSFATGSMQKNRYPFRRRLATVQRLFRTVAIDVCLLLNFVVVFSSSNFRFRFVKTSARIYRPSFHENKPKTLVYT
jgi:hypothetical protein